MSVKNSLENKALRRAKKIVARDYPQYYTLKENVSAGGKTYSKLVKKDKSKAPSMVQVIERGHLEPEVLYK